MEQFRQITNYLAEQFRQIAHYLAEHLIHKNDVLFIEKFLTLWMQECKYSDMHIYSMQILNDVTKWACQQMSIQL